MTAHFQICHARTFLSRSGALLRGYGLFLFLLMALHAMPARADSVAVQTSWRLLDYIAVDYAGAVAGGKVVSTAEYAEMVEFAGEVEKRLAALPPTEAQGGLVRGAISLRKSIAGKAGETIVAAQARDLARALLAAYPVPLAPASPPGGIAESGRKRTLSWRGMNEGQFLATPPLDLNGKFLWTPDKQLSSNNKEKRTQPLSQRHVGPEELNLISKCDDHGRSFAVP